MNQNSILDKNLFALKKLKLSEKNELPVIIATEYLEKVCHDSGLSPCKTVKPNRVIVLRDGDFTEAFGNSTIRCHHGNIYCPESKEQFSFLVEIAYAIVHLASPVKYDHNNNVIKTGIQSYADGVYSNRFLNKGITEVLVAGLMQAFINHPKLLNDHKKNDFKKFSAARNNRVSRFITDLQAELRGSQTKSDRETLVKGLVKAYLKGNEEIAKFTLGEAVYEQLKPLDEKSEDELKVISYIVPQKNPVEELMVV